jgi:hypothetical protein
MQVRVALANAIDVVHRKIQQIRDSKESINEQDTKATLIDPILAALGWRPHCGRRNIVWREEYGWPLQRYT